MKKFFAIFAMALIALVGCEKKSSGGDDKPNNPPVTTSIDGQWHLVEWNGEAPEFQVYVEYKGGEFDIYQQVYSLYYEHFEGSYVVNGDIVTGSYSDGTNWASGYKFEVSGDRLIMYSQEDTSVKSIYEKCEIPLSVIEEATTTRAAEAAPFL